MGTRLKKICPKCGAYLIITETDDRWPGCKEREEGRVAGYYASLYWNGTG